MSIAVPEEVALHPAVENCMNAWHDEFQMCLRRGVKDYEARKGAKVAYRKAMPDLVDQESIHGFIACVGRGLLMAIFDSHEASKLLYAAQVASHSFAAVQKLRKAETAAPKPTSEAAA